MCARSRARGAGGEREWADGTPTNMDENLSTNKGTLQLVRGDAWGSWGAQKPSRRPRLRIPTSWMFELDEVEAAAARVIGSISRAFAKAGAGESRRHREWGQRVVEMHAAGITLEQALNWHDARRNWIIAFYRRNPQRPAPPRRVIEVSNPDRAA